MTINLAIHKLKYLLNMNQAQLARALDVSPSLFNLYAKNKRIPSGKTLKKISNIIKENNIDMKIEDFFL